MVKYDKKDFVSHAKNKHGNKYDYAKVVYKGSKVKVCITCPTHGDFWIQPSMHILGRGCRQCANIRPLSLSNNEFIEKAKKIHNGFYSYTKTRFLGIREKVVITCPIHGDFNQLAQSHLKGHGCRSCAIEKQRKNTEQFIAEARKVHGDNYYYNHTKYIDCKTKLCITCKIHGDFWQMANAHLQGEGCPNCNKSFGELRVKKFLDLNKIEYKQQYSVRNENLFCNNKTIYVDFFIQNSNTIIEYNGRQHYKPTNYFHHKDFDMQQERDNALRQYCKEHKIKLIEISYTEYDDIETILCKTLKINHSYGNKVK